MAFEGKYMPYSCSREQSPVLRESHLCSGRPIKEGRTNPDATCALKSVVPVCAHQPIRRGDQMLPVQKLFFEWMHDKRGLTPDAREMCHEMVTGSIAGQVIGSPSAGVAKLQSGAKFQSKEYHLQHKRRSGSGGKILCSAPYRSDRSSDRAMFCLLFSFVRS